jgi:hypothetical protein
VANRGKSSAGEAELGDSDFVAEVFKHGFDARTDLDVAVGGADEVTLEAGAFVELDSDDVEGDLVFEGWMEHLVLDDEAVDRAFAGRLAPLELTVEAVGALLSLRQEVTAAGGAVLDEELALLGGAEEFGGRRVWRWDGTAHVVFLSRG